MDKYKKVFLADISLLLIAAIWGSNFFVTKLAIVDVGPYLYLGLRFFLAFIIMFCFSYKKILESDKRDILISIGVGCLLFGGFAAQTNGLKYASPGISGFLTITYVIIVPLLIAFKEKRMPDRYIVIAAVFTMVGIGLISLNGEFMLGKGERMTLVGALFFALHILALGKVSKKINPLVLTTIQLGMVSIFSLLLSLPLKNPMNCFTSLTFFAVVYGAIFGSIGGFFGQTFAQRFTLPSHVAILISTEGVFALVFSIFAGMEYITLRHIWGFCFVFISVMYIEIRPYLLRKQKIRI